LSIALAASGLTVLVFLPGGLFLLRQQQRQAAEARQQAEHNFRLARQAVDDYLTAVTETQEEPDHRRQELLQQAEKFRQLRDRPDKP
jgi:hypothetical protein